MGLLHHDHADSDLTKGGADGVFDVLDGDGKVDDESTYVSASSSPECGGRAPSRQVATCGACLALRPRWYTLGASQMAAVVTRCASHRAREAAVEESPDTAEQGAG
jgi:hypothetical protein